MLVDEDYSLIIKFVKHKELAANFKMDRILSRKGLSILNLKPKKL